MGKKITLLTLIVFIFLIIFTACSDMDPLGIVNGVPEGYNPDVDNDWIYYAEGSTIKKMRLDGSEVSTAFIVNYSQGEIRKLLLDPIKQKIYIFNYSATLTNDIYQYNLDGSGEVLIATEGTSNIVDMSIDHINGYLYYIWSGGITGINLEVTSSKTSVFSGTMATSTLYVGSDLNGRVYYIDGSYIYEVDTSITSLPSLPLGIPSTSPMTISSSLDGSILYYYDTNVIYKINTTAKTSTLAADPIMLMSGDMVLYEKGGKIYYYSDDAAQYKIYSITLDGTETKDLILDNASTPIKSFDILAK